MLFQNAIHYSQYISRHSDYAVKLVSNVDHVVEVSSDALGVIAVLTTTIEADRFVEVCCK